ncbi:MAG TPA: hypothetical protein VF904_11835 [Anaeromyxobacteraceae bacterium]
MNRPSLLLAAAALALAACGPARIETDPATIQLFGRGQQARIHAVALASNGRALANEVCAWSSSEPNVAKVEGRHNEATVTAVGHGRAVARCSIGSVKAEVPITVTTVSRVDISPKELQLRILDEIAPAALAVRAFDGDGREVQGRIVATRCQDENVCRGDARGQVWPVGPGDSKVVVRVDDGEGEAPVHVVDARTAAGRPRAVSGNPMEHLDAPPPPERRRAKR